MSDNRAISEFEQTLDIARVPHDFDVTGWLPIPSHLANRYQLISVLGTGGMGTVYRADDEFLDSQVALKVLRRRLAQLPAMTERFRREVVLSRQVTHRNIARVFDLGHHGPDVFFTMELIEGQSLGDILKERGRLDLPQVLDWAAELALGLGAVHDAGVLHRDLKPANVLISSDGRVVLTDFGVAQSISCGKLTPPVQHALVGTPLYMAPEQIDGARALDERCDIYAFGAMLFHLLTGVAPWEGDNPLELAHARRLRPPTDPRQLHPLLPKGVSQLIMACMRRDPDARPQTIVSVYNRILRLRARLGECESRRV